MTEKTLRAAKEYNVKQVIVAGGVAANQGLRKELKARFNEIDIPLLIPPLNLCTDNAAMIAAAGYYNYTNEERADLRLNAIPNLKIGE